MTTGIGCLRARDRVEVKWVEGEDADHQFYSAVVTAVCADTVELCYTDRDGEEISWKETLLVSEVAPGRVQRAHGQA